MPEGGSAMDRESVVAYLRDCEISEMGSGVRI